MGRARNASPSSEDNSVWEPLLRSNDEAETVETQIDHRPTKFTSKALIIIAIGFFVDCVSLLASNMADVGGNGVLERNLCREKYGDIPDTTKDPRCKDDEIQGRIAYLNAYLYTFYYVPTVLCAIPYGLLADKIGRKKVYYLGPIGMFLTNVWVLIVYRFPDIFPPEAIYFGGIFGLVGGGPNLSGAIFNTMLSETVPPQYLSNVYLFTTMANLVGAFISGPLGYFLQPFGPWFTLTVSISMFIIAMLVALLIPETMNPKLQTLAADTTDDDDNNDDANRGFFAIATKKVIESYKEMYHSCRAIFCGDRALSMLVGGTAFADLGLYGSVLLQQYMTKRLNITWAEANLLGSIRIITKVVFILALFPAIGYFSVHTFHIRPMVRDLWTARLCILLYMIGAFVIASSNHVATMVTGLILYAFFTPYWATLNSILTRLSGQDKRALMFACVGLLANVGNFMAGPILAESYNVGLRWGGEWVGLPFYIVGGLLSLVVIINFCVRIPEEKLNIGVVEDDSE